MTSDLYQSFVSFISTHKLLDENAHIVAGLSGGADSVCLVLLLKRYCEEKGGSLTAVHINHKLRKEAADADASFAKHFCEEQGIPCRIETIDVGALAGELRISEEEAGRLARYQAFVRIAKEVKGSIAVAHHRDDNAETVLLNLVRGTGIRGLTGMKPESRVEGCRLIRPLLFADREQIEGYLKERDIPFCTDSTNADLSYARNRIRHGVLPELSKVNSKAADHICRSAQSLWEIEAYLEKETEKKMKQILSEEKGEVRIRLEELRKEDPLFAKRIVYRAIALAAGAEKDITAEHVAAVLLLVSLQSGKKSSLPYGLTALRVYDEICLVKNAEEAEKNPAPVAEIPKEALGEEAMQIPLPGGRTALLSVVPAGPENRDRLIEKNTYTKAFDYDKIVGVIKVGEKVPGDRIVLQNGTKTLKKLFTDEKIPADKRAEVLLFKDAESVFWAVPFRISEQHKITESTKRAVVISIKGEKNEPWD